MESSTTDVSMSDNSAEIQAESATDHVALDDLCQIQHKLLVAITTSSQKESLLSDIGRVLSDFVKPHAVQYFHRDENGGLTLAWQALSRGSEGQWKGIDKQLRASCDTACERGHPHMRRVDGVDGYLVVSVPIVHRKQAPEALAVVVSAALPCLDRVIVTLQLVASHLTLWHVLRESSAAESETQASAALVELLGKLASCDDLHQACYTVVGQLQDYLGCDCVALGMRRSRPRDCRLAAVSGRAEFDKNSEFTRAFEAAFDESIVRGTLSTWPPIVDSQRPMSMAQQRLCSLIGAQTVMSAPLQDERGTEIGAWVFLGDEDFGNHRAATNFIRASQQPIGSCLRLLQRSQRGPVTRVARSLLEDQQSWRGTSMRVTACILIAMLVVPMPYKIKCECQIQPVVRRFVAAPFDGKLERVLVEPGEFVSRGDVLARMDGRDIRWELAGLIAERGRASKQRDVALASHDVVTAQIAKLELERLDVNIRMLENRAEHLEITNTIDGIVISGDQKRAEGAPLSIGQTLFEIAPLDKMSVEIAIPEDEISYVRRDLPVVVRLDAYPRRQWQGAIANVHPRSENKDDQNVFIAEVRLDNTDGFLRPGMNGKAKIITGYRPLVWNLFHKPLEIVFNALGW